MNITSGSPIGIIVIRLKNIIKTIESADLDVKTNINVILYYMTNSKNLPYRKGVGMMIINRESKVFVGKRIDTKTRGWQMPQGGMNTGETPSRAVFREMKEEIGTSKGEIIAESKYWYSYDLPEFLIPKLWDGAYKGQKQKWFLIRYTGSDEDINIKTATPEFYEWGWVDIEDLPVMIVHFKKKLYNAVLREFKSLI